MDPYSRPLLKNSARRASTSKSRKATTPPQTTPPASHSPLTSKPLSSLRNVMSSDDLRAGAHDESTASTASNTPRTKNTQVPTPSRVSQKSNSLPRAASYGEKRGPSDAVTSTLMTSQAQVPLTPMRSASGIKRTVEAVSAVSEDEGGEIQSNQRPRKKSRPTYTTQYESYTIGRHIDEPRITIVAKLVINNKEAFQPSVVILAAKSPEFPISFNDDSRWAELVPGNSRINIDKVVQSDAINGLSHPEKLGRIKDYLLGKQNAGESDSENEDENDIPPVPVKYSYTPELLEVGFDRDDASVPVQAYVRMHSGDITTRTLGFKVLKADAVESDFDYSRLAIRDPSRIKFKAEFQGRTFEKTKEKIFRRFSRYVVNPEIEGFPTPRPKTRHSTQTVASDDEDSAIDTLIVRPLGSIQTPQVVQSPSKMVGTGTSAVETAISAMRIAESELSMSYQDLSTEKAALSKNKSTADKRDASTKQKANEQEKLAGQLELREKAIAEQEANVTLREDAVKDSQIRVYAQEEALGSLKLADQLRKDAHKAIADVETKKKLLNERISDLNREKDVLRDNRAKFNTEKKADEQSMTEREKTVEEREIAVDGKDQAVTEREIIVKQDTSFIAAQKSVLSNPTEEELTQAIKKNEWVKGVIKRNVIKQVDDFKAKQASAKNPSDPEEDMSKKEHADEKKNPALADLQALGAAPQFSQFIPQPLLPPNTLFGKNYGLIPEGEPNAGMYKRIFSRTGELDGKSYLVYKILLECTHMDEVTNPVFVIDGEKLGEIVHLDNFQFDCYMKDGMQKLVQRLGPKSWVFHRSRFFVSWYVYKENVPDYTV